MSISTTEKECLAMEISFGKDSFAIQLADGRTITIPLAWYPRLQHATKKEQDNYRLIGKGVGIHWPLLDEDISVEDVLAGKSSNENQRSLKAWLKNRKKIRR